MKFLPYLILSAILIFSRNCFAQDYKEQYNQIKDDKDTLVVFKVLSAWEKAQPNDPEVYVAWFNFYAHRSMSEQLSLNKDNNGDKALELKDKDNKIAGYLGSTTTIDLALLQKGFNYIDTAIKKFPDRLDMRFGEVYMLGKINAWDKFTEKIITVINYGDHISLKWLWGDNKPIENPKNFVLETVQTYVNQLFNVGYTQAEHIGSVAQTVLKYYPDDVKNLSDLAVSFIFQRDYKNALLPLLKAEKLAPTDHIVLNNIAYCYSSLHDKINAIKYYILVEKYGDENAKKAAAEKLEALRKQ